MLVLLPLCSAVTSELSAPITLLLGVGEDLAAGEIDLDIQVVADGHGVGIVIAVVGVSGGDEVESAV